MPAQCQAQLELLHEEIRRGGGGGGGGEAKRKKSKTSDDNDLSSSSPPPWPLDPSVFDEFLAYRILYQAAHGMTSAGERMALTRTLAREAAREEEDEAAEAQEGEGEGEGEGEKGRTKEKKRKRSAAVEHALAVRAAISERDFCAFFRLYSKAPRLGRLLMDVAAPAMRFYALNAVVKAVKPVVPVPFLARTLGFLASDVGASPPEEGKLETPPPGCSSASCLGRCHPSKDEEEGCAAAAAWLAAHGAVLVQDPSIATAADTGPAGPRLLAADCKASTGRLFVPEDSEAVAHGDANLAIDDFLSRAMGV